MFEPDRPDAGNFSESALGAAVEGRDGEQQWLNITDEVSRPLSRPFPSTKVACSSGRQQAGEACLL